MNKQTKISTFKPGRYFVRPIPFKAHRVEGFSPEILERHYEEVYGGAVRHLNQLELKLATPAPHATKPADRAKLKAEESALTNAIVLHETYFDSAGDGGGDPLTDENLNTALWANFSGVDGFIMEVRKTYTCWDHKAGWIVLAWHETLGRLGVFPVLAGQGLTAASPLLALNLSDYAFKLDLALIGKHILRLFSPTFIGAESQIVSIKSEGCTLQTKKTPARFPLRS